MKGEYSGLVIWIWVWIWVLFSIDADVDVDVDTDAMAIGIRGNKRVEICECRFTSLVVK